MDHDFERHFICTGRVRLHVVQAGPQDGPLVVLLHGFPEFWYGWRHQIPFLAANGYRVWAPDQRGYNLSDRPKAISAYRLDELAADVIGLIDAAGRRRAFIIGHDWGGAVAWQLASRFPERIERAVILNVPHPQVMVRQLLRSPRQLLRSWYVFYFQIPWLPERLARMGNFALVTRALKKTSRPGTFNEADLARYREAWLQPGSFRAMLNWYRAARYRFEASKEPIEVPTLLIWGAQDAFLIRQLAPASIGRCRDGKLVFLEEAGHFVQHEECERVNELIQEFLAQAGPE
jgi:pimeloyl-ACP methyl ester carboxylesterase